MFALLLTSLVVLQTAAAAEPAARPRLVILDLVASGGVDSNIGAALTDAVTTEVSNKNLFAVVSASDIRTALGFERQKQMMGCSEDNSCFTELAGAMGARFVLTGSITKLGDAYQLTLKTVDTHNAQSLGRSVRIASNLGLWRQQIPYAVSEATATPAPRAPSEVLPYSLMIGGGLFVIGGAVLGAQALAQDTALATEQSLGVTQRGVLKPDAYYRQQASALQLQKSLSLGAGLVGAAAVGVGVYFLVADAAPGGGRVALVPAGPGVALVGSFE